MSREDRLPALAVLIKAKQKPGLARPGAKRKGYGKLKKLRTILLVIYTVSMVERAER